MFKPQVVELEERAAKSSWRGPLSGATCSKTFVTTLVHKSLSGFDLSYRIQLIHTGTRSVTRPEPPLVAVPLHTTGTQRILNGSQQDDQHHNVGRRRSTHLNHPTLHEGQLNGGATVT